MSKPRDVALEVEESAEEAGIEGKGAQDDLRLEDRSIVISLVEEMANAKAVARQPHD